MLDITDVSGTAGHTCACGGHDEELPVLDAQSIPHAVRHGAIMGALEQLRPGASMILTADHDPLPLLRQIGERFGDTISWQYVVREPGEIRLRLDRAA